MTASFAQGGLIATSMALAIMLGADVGTSLVAQVFTSGVAALSPPMIILGVAMFNLARSNRPKAVGRLIFGLGLLLLALKMLVAATEPLRASAVLAELLSALGSAPLLAVFIGALLTLLASSSLAIILLCLSLGAGGVAGPEVLVALVLGANLGSGMVPVIATWGAGPVARRAPLGNLILRALGVAVALPALGDAVPWLLDLTGNVSRLAVDAHLAFNLALAVAGLPLIGVLARILDRVLPAVEVGEEAPQYLDGGLFGSPTVALAAAARETLRIGDVVQTMLEHAAGALRSGDADLCSTIADMDDRVDSLQEAVKLYLTRLGREGALDDDEAQRATEVISYAINLEHAGDIIDRNLRDLISKKIKNQLVFSEDGRAEIESLIARTLENLRLAQTVFFERDARLARRLLDIKTEIRLAERESADNHLARLQAGTPETLLTSSLHLDIMRDLKRINAHLFSVAYPVLEH
jgi:phosphate:Na+ symporter